MDQDDDFSHPPALPSKAEIRSQIRKQRRTLSATSVKQFSQQLKTRIAKSPEYRKAKRMAFYWPTHNEIDPKPVLKQACLEHKECFLPVLNPNGKNNLCFVPYVPGEPMKANQYKIPEPLLNQHRIIPLWSLDIVFLPLIAFDLNGNRLGQGGGYYDKTFANCQAPRQSMPKRIGLAYAFQQIDQLPIDPWDIPLDGIITEQQIIRFSP